MSGDCVVWGTGRAHRCTGVSRQLDADQPSRLASHEPQSHARLPPVHQLPLLADALRLRRRPPQLKPQPRPKTPRFAEWLRLRAHLCPESLPARDESRWRRFKRARDDPLWRPWLLWERARLPPVIGLPSTACAPLQ